MTSSTQKESVSYKIFVGGLDADTTEEDLTEYFSRFGRVVERLIKVDLKTKRSRGFAFIGFKTPEAVDRVLEIDHHRLKGKKIDCKRAMTKEDAYSLNKNLKESCRKVYISNIPRELSKDDLKAFFREFGKMVDFNLIFKKKETGFLYIIFESEEVAVSLIERKSVEINGFRLEIQKAIPKESKDGQEEESRGTAAQQTYQNNSTKYRNSFESPYSYQSMFSGQNISGIAVVQNHPHNRNPCSPYEKIDHHNYTSNHLPEVMSPYERPLVTQHPNNHSGPGFGYPSTRMYPQPQISQFQASQNEHFFDRVPVRNRVRSEQAINTISPLFMSPQVSHMYPTNSEFDMRQVNPRSRIAGHSFSHMDNHGYPRHPHDYLSSPLLPHEKPASLNSLREVGGQLPKQRTVPEFTENAMDFKSFRPKDPPPPKSEAHSGSPQKKDSTPKMEAIPDSRQTKLAKIKMLEDDIKATKEKLKSLEEKLRLELATVDEGLAHKEGLSHSSNE